MIGIAIEIAWEYDGATDEEGEEIEYILNDASHVFAAEVRDQLESVGIDARIQVREPKGAER